MASLGKVRQEVHFDVVATYSDLVLHASFGSKKRGWGCCGIVIQGNNTRRRT